MFAFGFLLHSHMLYIDCLSVDVLVHNLTSSRTTVDLNEARGMLLFKPVLAELEQRGGGGWTSEQKDASINCLTVCYRHTIEKYFLHCEYLIIFVHINKIKY